MAQFLVRTKKARMDLPQTNWFWTLDYHMHTPLPTSANTCGIKQFTFKGKSKHNNQNGTNSKKI
jgi:hypothetical protein